MKIVIWGAGAIGGTLGAYLIKAGHDIVFVDIVEAHVNAINQTGLRISGPVDEFTVEAEALMPHQLQGQYETILLCTKSQHTRAAMESLSPFVADNGFVMSVQNGLNELIIQEFVGRERTLGTFINFSADYHGPGEILFGGRGAVVIGELDGSVSDRLKRMEAICRDFDENTLISDNIWGYLWGKEAYGAMLFVSALTHQSISRGACGSALSTTVCPRGAGDPAARRQARHRGIRLQWLRAGAISGERRGWHQSFTGHAGSIQQAVGEDAQRHLA